MPRMRNSIILIFAVGSGFAAFLISMSLINPQKPVTSAGHLVVGAVRDIDLGSMIKKEDVDLLPPPDNINPKILFSEFTPVVGKVSRRNILKGEVIKSVDLLEEGENLASLVPRGYRAMTIPITLPSSLTNMLHIGNRIDVLLTFERSRGEVESVTLVKNAKVIGLSEPPGKNASMGQDRSMYITLAVTPDGAETLAYSMKKGTLNISIHSLSDADEESEKFFTLKELFFSSAATGSALHPKTTDKIEIIRGLHKEDYRPSEAQDQAE